MSRKQQPNNTIDTNAMKSHDGQAAIPRQAAQVSHQPTVIGETCRLTGDLVLEGDAIILGTVEGMVEVTGQLEIGQSGVVRGSIRATMAELSGQVNGDAICETELHIASSGTLLGNIYTRAFVVQDGATCRGQCIIGHHAMEAAEQSSENICVIRNSSENESPDAMDTVGRITTSTNIADDTIEDDASANQGIATKSSSVAGLMRRRSSVLQGANSNRSANSA